MAEDNKSLRFPEETDKKLSKLAEKLGRSKKEVFLQMVDYFDKSKKDPADLNDDLLKKEVSQGINRIISFIKTQEKDTLAPMLADVREGMQVSKEVEKLQRSLWTNFMKKNWDQFQKEWKEQEEVLYQLFRLEKVDQKLHVKGYLGQEFAQCRSELHNLRSETRRVLETSESVSKKETALKTAFELLLKDYFNQREKLNSLTQGKAITSLQEETLNQIKKL